MIGIWSYKRLKKDPLKKLQRVLVIRVLLQNDTVKRQDGEGDVAIVGRQIGGGAFHDRLAGEGDLHVNGVLSRVDGDEALFVVELPQSDVEALPRDQLLILAVEDKWRQISDFRREILRGLPEVA